MKWRVVRVGVLTIAVLGVMVGLVALPAQAATCAWSGNGGDGLWATATNWSGCTGGGVPATTDSVLLNNTTVSGSYTVTLPSGSTAITITQLTITPDWGNNITLILPSGNTANPGLCVGDSTAGTDDIILNNGAVLRNSTGAGAGNGIQAYSTSNGTVRINNGGRYIHNTVRSTAGVVPLLSTVTGTETGVFEYDAPGTGTTSISASGRNYGSLTLTRTAGAATYNATGSNPLTVRGNFIINSGVTFNNTLTGVMNVAGNWSNSGTFTGSGAVTFNGSSTLPTIQRLTGNTTFNNLTIDSGAIVDVGDSVLTVNGTYTNTGQLRRSPSSSIACGSSETDATGHATVVWSNCSVAYVARVRTAAGYGFPNVDLDGNGVYGNCSASSDLVYRYWDIAPDGALLADVTFSYRSSELHGIDPANLTVYKCVGSTWTPVANSLASTVEDSAGYRSVTATNIPIGSGFALSGPSAPTAVTLSSITAHDDSKITLGMLIGLSGLVIVGAIAGGSGFVRKR